MNFKKQSLRVCALGAVLLSVVGNAAAQGNTERMSRAWTPASR
jgi:hypothetical protein